jgi:ankyrin repeat protein
MQISARNGHIEMLELISSWRGSVFTRGPKGDTLYHLAAYNGHLDTLAWLQVHGIVPTAVDLQGQTAVHVACRRCEPDVLLYLHRVMGLTAAFLDLDFDGKTPVECIPRFSSEDPDKVARTKEIAGAAVEEAMAMAAVLASRHGSSHR